MAENRSARNEFPQGFRISGSKNRGSARKITFAFNHGFWLPVCPLVVCVEYIFFWTDDFGASRVAQA